MLSNRTTGIWRPLLEGDLAAEAEEVVHAIAEALAAQSSPDVSVSSGKAGLALFYGYLARTTDGDAQHHAERADELLDQAVEALAANPMSPDLYGGFTGIAWVAEHFSSAPGQAEEEPSGADDDMSAAIDEGLLTAIAAPWTGDYDLVRGLVGFGVYALERVPHPSARRCLEAIVDRMNESAESLGDGVTWFTPPELLPGPQREQYPRGYYNLGVAHGVPGVIGLLADACRLGIRPETARPLLEGAVRWVLSHRLPEGRAACFPALLAPGMPAPGIEARPSRLAWCYGEPGVAVSLLYAAHTVGKDEWERAALDIAAHAARVAPEDSGVQDAGLCHGAFGLAHLYNRIYQAGGGEPFADAARLWYRRGLDMRRPEGGIAGYEAWHLGANMQFGWVADPGFLTGVAGMGLALLAGITSVEPEWDRLLMAAIPPIP